MTHDERATGTPHSASVPPRPLHQEAGTPTVLPHGWWLVWPPGTAAWVSCPRRSSLAASVLTAPPWQLRGLVAFHLVGVADSLFPHDHRNTQRRWNSPTPRLRRNGAVGRRSGGCFPVRAPWRARRPRTSSR